jgi:hypothetical protein
VLVEGLHHLEAAKALGEKTIVCFLVEARKLRRKQAEQRRPFEHAIRPLRARLV